MKKLSTLILSSFIFSVCAESSAITKDETIIDNTRDSNFFKSGRSYEISSSESAISLESKVQNNREILSSSSINSKEEVSYEDIMKNGSFNINKKVYMIDINDNLEKLLINEDIQNELLKKIQLVQKRVPSDKVVGYSFSWSNKKINVSSFLGDNAK